MFCNYLFLLRRCSFHSIWLIILSIIIFLSLFDVSRFRKDLNLPDSFTSNDIDCVSGEVFHRNVVEKYYEKRKNWTTSNLGTIMFKNVDASLFARKNKDFLVMVWKNWQKFVSRHVTNYDPKTFKSLDEHVLANCSVKNCRFSGNPEHFFKADAVIMTGDFVPKVSYRNRNQRWVFLSEASPMRTPFLRLPYYQIRDLANIFNWTMTYRSDSDIPIPYGRTLPLPNPNDIYMETPEDVLTRIVPYWAHKQTSVVASILISNCSVKKRMDFIESLRRHIKVDGFGNCSEGASHFCRQRSKDCPLTGEYLFYLVLEPASCRQYITEKVFQHAYIKGAIPIIMGPPIEDCEKLLPPNSFIHTSLYKTPADLAEHLSHLAKNSDALLRFHEWRLHFRIENEHGYFGSHSPVFCRICEALNYNDGGEKIYSADDLELYFGRKITCDVTYV